MNVLSILFSICFRDIIMGKLAHRMYHAPPAIMRTIGINTLRNNLVGNGSSLLRLICIGNIFLIGTKAPSISFRSTPINITSGIVLSRWTFIFSQYLTRAGHAIFVPLKGCVKPSLGDECRRYCYNFDERSGITPS